MDALSHNVIWVIVGTIVPIAIGLLLAVLLWGHTRGRLIFRIVYFMPVVMSAVVVGIIWGWIYNPIFGFLNHFLDAIGLESLARGWLGETNTALFAVMAAAIWQYVGFCVVILFAGLQKVDIELIDAAKIDGANSWQRFLSTSSCPQIRDVLTMVTVYTVIGGFNVFDIVFILTKGGPANATELIATYTYKNRFRKTRWVMARRYR